MRWKITFILILLNIAVFFGISYFQKNERNKHPESRNVLGTTIIDIDKIEILNKSIKEPRILERQNGQWKITNPIEWPANLFAIQRIITQLQFLIHEARFSIEEIQKNGQSLEDYGLKDPNIILKFRGINGEHTLAIGNPTPVGNRVYIMDPDQKHILVVKNSLLESIDSNLEELYAQQIFNIPLYDLNKLKIQILSPHNLKIWLSKNKDSWGFDAPIQTNANNILVNNAINQLISLSTHKILLGEEADHAAVLLHNPLMKITLEGNNQKQTLIVADPENQPNNEKEYYAQLDDSSTIFTVSAKPFDTLRDAQEKLREKQLINIKASELKNINIGQSRKKIQLQKLENGQWQLVSKDNSGKLITTAADDKEMAKIQQRLNALEIVSFVSDAPSNVDLENFGFNDPQRIIELDADKKQVLFVGGLDPLTGNLYAKLEDYPYVYCINPNILSFFPINELYYKMRVLDRLPKGAIITGLKITHLDSKDEILFDQIIDPINTDWETALANLETSKKIAILGIIEDLKEFKVKNFLKNHFEEPISLDAETHLPWLYKIEATTLLPGGDISKTTTLEYYFTKRLNGGLQIGGSKQKDTVFSSDQSWIDHLFAFHLKPQPSTE